MTVLSGFSGLVFGGLIVLLVGLRFRSVAVPLWTAFGLRTAFSLIHYFGIWMVPGGRADAVSFEKKAAEYAQLPWPDFLAAFNHASSYVFSWFGAVLYKVFGVSPLLFTSINVLLGSLIIPITYWLAIRLFDRRVALFSAWVTALMPFAVFYSSVLLREVASIFPFMLGLVAVTYWIERPRLLHAATAVMLFAVASVFHGGWAVAIVGFALVALREHVSALLQGAQTGRPRVRMLLASTTVVIFVGLAAAIAIAASLRLGSMGAIDQLVMGGGDTFRETATEETRGGSAYPAFVAGIDPVTQPWGVPLRIAYFLFSPFPWDIATLRHLQGLVATAAFLAVAIGIWRGRERIRGNRRAQAVLFITGAMVFVFAFGTTNIGTSIRHRTKFFFALAALACGPILRKRLVWRSRSAPATSRPRTPDS